MLLWQDTNSSIKKHLELQKNFSAVSRLIPKNPWLKPHVAYRMFNRSAACQSSCSSLLSYLPLLLPPGQTSKAGHYDTGTLVQVCARRVDKNIGLCHLVQSSPPCERLKQCSAWPNPPCKGVLPIICPAQLSMQWRTCQCSTWPGLPCSRMPMTTGLLLSLSPLRMA